MGLLYANGGKIYASEYTEIYVPRSYFESGVAENRGATIETFGICYICQWNKGNPGDMKLFTIPTVINLNAYDYMDETINVHGNKLNVTALKYMKDSCVMHQTLTKGKDVSEQFIAMLMGGKLPSTLNYAQLLDLWWQNLEISGISLKVPSKVYEMIIASIYRNPNNVKERYGQLYGRQNNPSGYDYKTGDVRNVVKNLSTFSGMVFEDIGAMITSGINNSVDNIDEPVSPLEKIIHY